MEFSIINSYFWKRGGRKPARCQGVYLGAGDELATGGIVTGSLTLSRRNCPALKERAEPERIRPAEEGKPVLSLERDVRRKLG